MKTAYYYLYYRIYSLWKKMPGRDYAFSAMTALSLLMIFNIATFIIYFRLLKYYSIQQVKIPVILSVVLILIVNYFIFIFKDKFLEIEKRFICESEKHKKLKSIPIIIYVFLTFIFLFWVLFNK
jgi:cytochrome c biogenesis protein CcdA